MYLKIGLVLAATISIAPAPAPGTAAEQLGTGRSGSVTLLTGDRVVVTGQAYRVEPGPAGTWGS
ncbi:hypothetical protein GCM10010404_15460 [Nonomuraea africana]|uniref:Uncharacterized protein n=1 Tax=Nonomuraea africana TaxID=46171 RepID=A0ABR9KM74_9ACTN|nr:hypothetical protein [Nonomuraea africana]